MDVFATVAAIGRAEGSAGLDSVSMIPYLHSTSAPAQRTHILAETRTNPASACGANGWSIAVRDTTHKLHVANYGSGSEDYELYDLRNDRWEKLNLWDGEVTDTERTIFEALRAAIDSILGDSACP